jgi:ankyrin repeat protein
MMASHRPRHTTAQAGDSSSVIYDAAKDSDWQRVLELCETNPDCASYQGPDGSTALHLACSQKCPDTAVFETLLQTSPDSVLKQEDKGMVPLHYACRFQASVDIVRVMVKLFPEFGVASVSKRDRKGRTPLFYAEKEGAPLDVVSMLREIYPNGSEVRMEDDELEVQPSPKPEVR